MHDYSFMIVAVCRLSTQFSLEHLHRASVISRTENAEWYNQFAVMEWTCTVYCEGGKNFRFIGRELIPDSITELFERSKYEP